MDDANISMGERHTGSSLPMNTPAPDPELLHSLGRLVRGLSALFWGLPAALIVCIGTAFQGWFSVYNIFPPLVTTALLAFGLWQMDSFQKQERPWRNALDRAKLLALVNLGLSPFVFWWNHVPGERLFSVSVRVLMLSAWFFLFSLNTMLLRLSAMLPDETLRQETRQFTGISHIMLLVLLFLYGLRAVLANIPRLPQALAPAIELWDNGAFWLLLLLALLPLAMTMALIWKTKEVILDSVFGMKN